MKITYCLLPLVALAACGNPKNTDSAQAAAPENSLELKRIKAEAEFGDVTEFSEGIARIFRYDSVGYIDSNNKVIIPRIYKAGTMFHEGLCGVVDFDDHVKYFDRNGKLAFECPDATFPYEFNKGYAVFMGKDEKFGLMDKTGKVLIPAKYNQTSFNIGDRFAVDSADNHWGIVDPNDKWIVHAKYRSLGFTDDQGYVLCQQYDGKYGFIDATGKELVPFKFYNLYGFQNDRAAFINEGDHKMGYIDRKGQVVIPAKYDQAEAFSEGLACVGISKGENDMTYSYIDASGKEIIPASPSNLSVYFSNGLAVFSENGKYGYMDQTGKKVIPAVFDEAQDFERSYGKVTKGGESYYINKAGKRIQ